jgi:hypothetical protein
VLLGYYIISLTPREELLLTTACKACRYLRQLALLAETLVRLSHVSFSLESSLRPKNPAIASMLTGLS